MSTLPGFRTQRTPWLYPAIAICILGVFMSDLVTPLGVAVWVLYFVPVGLCFFAWLPRAPWIVAAVCSVLTAIAFFTDSAGVDPSLAVLNRCLGAVGIWATAVLAFQVIRNRLEVRTAQWVSQAQSELSQKLAGEQKLDAIAGHVLSFLAPRVLADAGVLFVREAGQYKRRGGFALASTTALPQEFKLGDGQLGEAARQAKLTLLEVPQSGHIEVASALTAHRARFVTIVPFSADGLVLGVAELGFSERPQAPTLILLERISEQVAVSLRSALHRERLEELLAETQQQSEELQAQSEELRVTNEELEEQSRVLKESQTRLEQQQAELEQTNTELEEQSQSLEAQKRQLSTVATELEMRTRELEQSNRYKSEFLANMSHELRTPLNSSLILAKLLAENPTGNLTSEQIKYAETIQAAGNDLLTLINDILDLAKIEAGKVDFLPSQIRLSGVIETMSRLFQPVAQNKNLQFSARLLPGAPQEFESDSQRVQQIIKNLLSNALKFTEKGQVTLDISDAGEGRIQFAVTDSGIGIREDQLEIIFEAFRQADGTTNRKYGGTGLGLSISRELARSLGGDISVKSEVGRGTCFTLVLPRAFQPASPRSAETVSRVTSPLESKLFAPKTSAAATPEPVISGGVAHAAGSESRSPVSQPAEPRFVQDDLSSLTPERRCLLIVEDDKTFAQVLLELAREKKFQAVIASTADEALRLANQIVPHGIILDVGLPDNSGLYVLDRLKADARTRHIPVHVVSGSDYAHTALSLGAVGYMLKPVQREDLTAALQQMGTRLSDRVRRVLVVEDDAVQLESVQKLLKSDEVETLGARTAEQALQLLKEKTFDCMVLDLSLPDATGLQLLETLSREEAYSFPPVIVYTGRDLRTEEEQRLRRYARSIIIKGARSPERLLEEVTLFLHQVVSELPPEQQRLLEKVRSRDDSLQGKRLLIVEDDVRNIFALTSILEPRGVKLQLARNGKEALDLLDRQSTSGEPPVDLILMDIMMPEMDGLTATRLIRQRPEWKRLPIIALTAKAMRGDQEDCLKAGANDYLAKPLDVNKLLSLIRVWMPR